MALISKIRKNFWFVLIILGLALASFVLMDVMSSRDSGGLGSTTVLGEVAGEKIDLREFERTERALYNSNSDLYSRRASLWNYLVEKTISGKAGEKLGLGVSRDELLDLQFGANLSPIIVNSFTDSRTGQVNRQQLMEIQQAIQSGQELGPDFRMVWAEQEKQIQSTKVQEKIANLVAMSMYTPSWLAEFDNKKSSETASFEYVKIPFSYVTDSEISVTDADYSAYLAENEVAYTLDEETRILSYVAYDVFPSKADTTQILEGFNALVEEFKVTDNDSLFATNNSGGISVIYSNLDDLSAAVKDIAPVSSIGDVIGPYIESENYVATKLVDIRMVPDSVEASILVKSTQNGAMTYDQAHAVIDSIKAVLVSGKATFDSMAIKHSDDPGSSFNGGDLGTFAQGAMMMPVNNAAFIDSKEGGLYVVDTDYGVNLIQVRRRIFNSDKPKYKIALISTPIVPSEATQDSYFDKANDLLSANRSLDNLKKAVEATDGTFLVNSRPVMKNDYFIEELGGGETSRSIIKWAFQSKVGEVSPQIYEYQDEVNYFTRNYVVVGLKSINPPGLISVDAAKDVIVEQVKNKKKADKIVEKISGNDINAIASTFGLDVASLEGISFNSTAPDLGNEPKVVAKVHGLAVGTVSKPIIGNTGVFVVKPTSKEPGFVSNNLPAIKQAANTTVRSAVRYNLWEALKKVNEVEDNRSKFF